MRVGAVLLVLCIVLIGATAMRFEHLEWGMPQPFHPNEAPKVRAARTLADSATGDTGYYNHPYMVPRLVGLAGWMTVDDATVVAGEPPPWWLAGRQAMAVVGVLTVLATFLLARALALRPRSDGDAEGTPDGALAAAVAGLVAAALLAVTPLHVVHSRYIKEDGPLALWITLAAWLAVRVARRGRPFDLGLAAAAAGLAMSTKFVGTLALLLVAVAAVVGRRTTVAPAGPRARVTSLALVVLVPAVVFCIVNLPMVLHFGASAAKDLEFELRHTGGSNLHPAIGPWEEWWTFHLRQSLIPGLGALLVTAAAAGFVALAWTKERGRLVFLAFPLIWYLVHEGASLKPRPNWERYMVPMAPLAAAGAAFLCTLPARWNSTGKRVAVAVGVTVLLGGAFTGALLRSRDLAADVMTDTRLQCRDWLAEALGPRGVVVCDNYGPPSPRRVGQAPWLSIGLMPQRTVYAERVNTDDWTVTQKLADGRVVALPVEAVVTSSFWRDAWVNQGQTGPLFESVENYYRRLDEEFGEPVKEFSAPSGTYAYHNPVLKVYLRRGGRARPAQPGK
jgi:hypothetical protein